MNRDARRGGGKREEGVERKKIEQEEKRVKGEGREEGIKRNAEKVEGRERGKAQRGSIFFKELSQGIHVHTGSNYTSTRVPNNAHITYEYCAYEPSHVQIVTAF